MRILIKYELKIKVLTDEHQRHKARIKLFLTL